MVQDTGHPRPLVLDVKLPQILDGACAAAELAHQIHVHSYISAGCAGPLRPLPVLDVELPQILDGACTAAIVPVLCASVCMVQITSAGHPRQSVPDVKLPQILKGACADRVPTDVRHCCEMEFDSELHLSAAGGSRWR